MDYALTEQLKVRGEVRYDNLSESDDVLPGYFEDGFFDDGVASEDDQVTAGVEVLYTF
jgi:hypothetical protein